jgi:hypothetical protein
MLIDELRVVKAVRRLRADLITLVSVIALCITLAGR